MQRLAICAAAIAASACATSAPTASLRVITVNGSASIELMPDRFTITATFRNRNPNQASGLAELSAQAVLVRDAAPALQGLKDIRIETTDVKLAAVQDAACMRNSDSDGSASCPVIGRVATIGFTVTGSPAARGGQLLSLLSQLGAETVEMQSYSLADPEAGHAKVLAAAVADARAKAQAIADAAGTRLGALQRVQYGQGFDDRYGGLQAAMLMEIQQPQLVTRQSVSPVTDLDIAPRPITLDEHVIAAFAVE